MNNIIFLTDAGRGMMDDSFGMMHSYGMTDMPFLGEFFGLLWLITWILIIVLLIVMIRYFWKKGDFKKQDTPAKRV